MRRKERWSLAGMFRSWQVRFALLLIAVSAVIYLIHYWLFHDLHHILVFLVEDIAFIPIEVLIVTLIIHRLLEDRDKKSMFQKLNMVIGSFYSEMGNVLLSRFANLDSEALLICKTLKVENNWDDDKFSKAHQQVEKFGYRVRVEECDIADLKEFLLAKRGFLLGILQNPNLLEHESFTDLLWAVFHLTEELMYREDFSDSPAADLDHLAGDIKRVYEKLVEEWLYYMEHLQDDYPYLFSLAIRTNPFGAEKNATVNR